MSRKSKEGEECKEVRRRCEQNAVRKLILRHSGVGQAAQVQRLANSAAFSAAQLLLQVLLTSRLLRQYHSYTPAALCNGR